MAEESASSCTGPWWSSSLAGTTATGSVGEESMANNTSSTLTTMDSALSHHHHHAPAALDLDIVDSCASFLEQSQPQFHSSFGNPHPTNIWTQMLLGSGNVCMSSGFNGGTYPEAEDKVTCAPHYSAVNNVQDRDHAKRITGLGEVGLRTCTSVGAALPYQLQLQHDYYSGIGMTAMNVSGGNTNKVIDFSSSSASQDLTSIVNKRNEAKNRGSNSSMCADADVEREDKNLQTKRNGNGNANVIFKRPRIEAPSAIPAFKVRKEKLGDRITALQQLVSPFGKTDTASVLLEAIGYIKFLQQQIRVRIPKHLHYLTLQMQHQRNVCLKSVHIELLHR
eukprot:TRINITY_DN6206_c0_g1_i2.p1 TRINITY_DN6206_c0_g1~~TRINITY_DN6206_c0_g1_i2.p1  ORF type:complete len:336 (-),score=41.24 TRINITY_DN6206_c0_g1_i2:457-1464(-)